MLPNSQAGYNLGFTKTHHIPRGHGDSEDVEISASHGDIDSAFNATKEKRASNVHLSDQSMVADCVNQLDKDRTTLRNMYTDFDHFPQPAKWIGPYISIHFLSLNPLLVRRRRYSRGERYPSALCGCHSL